MENVHRNYNLASLPFFLAIIITFVVSSLPAFAEDDTLAIEEVVVTARKIEESSQHVPLAITAISQKELAQANIRNLVDLNGYAPNVTIGDDPGRTNGGAIGIRGISATRTDDNSLDAPVGVIVDGIYLGTMGGQILENFDLERIEILRGPQGTLFGKNTVAGVINIIRSRPTGELGGKFKLTAGENGQQEVRAVVNTSLIKDKLAAKFFFTDMQYDGYMDHIAGGTMPQKDYRNYGIAFLSTPNDQFEALLTIEKIKDQSQLGASLTNYNLAPGVIPPPSDPADSDLSGGMLACTLFNSGAIPQWNSGVPCRTDLSIPDKTAINLRNPTEMDTNAFSLTMSYDLNDNMRLVSVTGYRDTQEDRLLDFDGTESDFITITRLNEIDQFSQEFRFEGNWDNVSLVAGAYYWDSEFTQDWITGGDFWGYIGSLSGYDLRDNTWIFGGALVPPGSPEAAALAAGLSPLEGCWTETFGGLRCDTGASLTGLGDKYTQRLFETQQTDSVAVFFQTDWEFRENWILTAGLRWTKEEKVFSAGQSYVAPVARNDVDNYPHYTNLDNEWTETSPKLGLSHRYSDDILFYVSYSEGFHSGGFFGVNQNQNDFERDQYKPEFAESWEFGMKSQLMENRVQLNITLFANQFTDKQESYVTFDGTTNTVATVFENIGDASYQGIELEMQWLVNKHLNLFFNYGYLDAEYDEFLVDLNLNDSDNTRVDGTHLIPRAAPEFTYGIGGQFTYPIGPGEVEIYLKYNKIDEQEISLTNLESGHVDEIENLSATIGYHWGGMSLVAFGRNLTDEAFEVPVLILPLFGSGARIPPKQWGVEFSVAL